MLIQSFLGIHNTNPPRSIPDAALVDAVNVDLTDSGAVLRRRNFTQALSSPISAAYSDDEIACLVSEGVLYRIADDLRLIELAPSQATDFCVHGGVLFTNDGLMVVDDVVHDLKTMHTPIVYEPMDDASHDVLPQGLNADPLTRFADPFPDNVDKIAWHDASLWCASGFSDQSLIRYSKPFHYHLFDYETNYIIVPGQVAALKGVGEALFIGTTDAMYLYNGALNKVADYGVIPGQPLAKAPNGTDFVFTRRGVCVVNPFQNLTETKVKPIDASVCFAQVIEDNGLLKFVAAHD